MNRFTRIRRPMTLVLLAAASVGVGVLPATADDVTTASSAPTTVELHDPAGDAAGLYGSVSVPGADIVKTRIDHGTSTVTLSTWFAGGTNPLTDIARVQETSRLVWWLDTNGDSTGNRLIEATVVDGVYRAQVLAASDYSVLCETTVSYDPGSYRHRVSVPRGCLGNPASLSVQVVSNYAAFVSAQSIDYFGDVAPDDWGWSTAAHRARVATSLSSSVSTSSLTYGQGVTVSGALTQTSNGKAAAGQKVTLHRKYPDGSYSKIATATTDGKGKVAFSLNPSRNATYQLRHSYAGAAGAGFDSAKSAARTITVKPKVTLAANATSVTSGTTVKLTTKVAPKHAGLEVKLQKRRTDGTWKTVQTAKLDSASTRTFKVTASKSTVGTYRVVAPKHGDHAQGTSPKVTIKLR